MTIKHFPVPGIEPSLIVFSRSVKYYFFSLKWRIQRAFYTHKRVGKWGCQGIGLEDIFLVTCKGASDTGHEGLRNDESGLLTLGDLGPDMKPQYTSNVVVNEWSLNEDEKRIYDTNSLSCHQP